mgnify:CR=1 FL=1
MASYYTNDTIDNIDTNISLRFPSNLGLPSVSSQHLMLKLDIVLCVIYSFFTLTAILTNSVVIIAIWKTKPLRSPSITLLCFLAITDLLTGLIVGPAFITSSVFRIKLSPSILAGRISVASSYTASTLSLLTLTLISLDKASALYFHLRYKQVVRNGAVCVAQCISAVFCCSITVARVLKPSYIFEILDFLILSICLSTNVLVYCYIFRIIRREENNLKYERKTAARINNQGHINVRRHKKSSITMASLTVLSIVCFVANFVAKLFTTKGQVSFVTLIALDFSDTALFVVATINPLCYSYRLSNVRNAVASVCKLR